MRIAHIVPTLELDRGGPSRSVAGMAASQARLGHQVTLVAGKGSTAPSAIAQGVDLRIGPHFPGQFEIPRAALAGMIREAVAGSDVVHLHSVWNGTITTAEAACRKASKPFILSPRGMLDAYSMQTSRNLKALYLCAVERSNLGAVSGWHFLDAAERRGCRWLKESRGKPWAVIPNGLDVEGVKAEADQAAGEPFAGYPDAAIRLVFLGRLDPIKDLQLQVRTVAALRERGADVRLYLVGPDYGEAEKLRALARDLAVEDRLVFVGPVYDGRRLAMLRAATAVLLTSHYECNSRSGAETMGVGGLLIATRRCHMDLASSFGAAITTAADPLALAMAVERVASDSPTSDNTRRLASEFARTRLPWQSVGGETVAFYERVLRAS